METRIYTPKELNKVVQKQEEKLYSQGKEISLNNKLLKWTTGFMIAIIITCFISFVSFIIDAWRFHGNKAEQYQETIEKLRKENIELKIQNKVDSYLKEQKQNKNKPEKTEQ